MHPGQGCRVHSGEVVRRKGKPVSSSGLTPSLCGAVSSAKSGIKEVIFHLKV